MKTLIFCVVLVLMLHCQVFAEVKDTEMRACEEKALYVRPFDSTHVRLLDGPFKHAQDLCVKTLLPAPVLSAQVTQAQVNYEPDRLLSNFRKRAGLEPKAKPYGGWESQALMGHSLGHYLSACSLMYISTGDKRFKERVDYIVDELEEIQNANGDGYAMCVPRGKKLFKEVSEGKITTQRFSLNGCWAPIYTLHKEMSGLRDAYRLCSPVPALPQVQANEKALQVEIKLADWLNTIIGDLTDEQMQKVMFCEHGGIMESLADLAADTGDKKYMNMARKFHHKEMMDPMIEHRDILSGHHGNTQVPKMIGMSRIYELTGDAKYKTGAEFFWDRVAHHHSYVTGGHGLNEHFGEPDKLNDRLGTNTSETCNVYNMLKLTSHLFCWEPRASVGDFYERALYNHILSSQHPQDGRVIYNLTLEMGGFKHYQNPYDFTCCIGTGMENHSQYGNYIYYHSDKELYVNLFIASTLDWKEKELRVTQDTKYPDDDKIKLTINCKNPVELAVYIRYPYWAQNGVEVKINGQAQQATSTPSSFIKLSRAWKDGDVIEIRFPMSLRLEAMPDNPKRVAIMYGPLVLAGELGPVNDPNAEDLLYVPVLLTSDRPVEQWVKPVSGKPNTFMLSNVGKPRDVELYPFYKMHDKRYTIYWDTFTEQEWTDKQKEYERIQKEKLELEARTVDFVQPGEQQPELDHNLQYENSNALSRGRGPKSRRAFNGGWFSYDLKVIPDEPLILQISYRGGRNNMGFDILVDGQKIAELSPTQEQGRGLTTVDYKLADELTKDKSKVTVKFAAHTGQTTGYIFGVRMLKEKK